MEAFASEKRRELIEAVSEVDDKLAESFLNDEPISPADLEVSTQLVNLVTRKLQPCCRVFPIVILSILHFI